jgi:hypothetical protein
MQVLFDRNQLMKQACEDFGRCTKNEQLRRLDLYGMQAYHPAMLPI